ncbi:TPA_asm: protein 3 [Aconitum virus 1]|uniref:Protein 3 n=1 Tax=Aconitum virus 1 TaxID=2977949 RepID=A0A9N6YIV1_9RHAB|nr:TPA_asm: protein 3 [Aconitum virus 1]
MAGTRTFGSFTRSESLKSVFPGTGQRLDGSSSRLLSGPLPADERYVLDNHAPHSIPREKAVFTTRWCWHPKGQEKDLDLGSIGLYDWMTKLKWGNSGSITDSEIHVIYLPHLPVELYRSNPMEISLIFDGSDGEEKMLSKAVFPSSLHTHVIFYPGHSFSVQAGSKFPWSLSMHTNADVRSDYRIADVIVMLKGYNTPISHASDKAGADIISLVPAADIPTGVTLTRPRGGGEWTLRNLHYGIRDKRDIEAIQLLQEAGIDLEGLQLVGKLKDAIKAVNKIGGIDTSKALATEKYQEILSAILPIVKRSVK